MNKNTDILLNGERLKAFPLSPGKRHLNPISSLLFNILFDSTWKLGNTYKDTYTYIHTYTYMYMYIPKYTDTQIRKNFKIFWEWYVHACRKSEEIN